MQDRVVIFDSRIGFSGTSYLTASFKFTPDYPCCHGNEIGEKIGYNSAYIRHIREMFAYNEVFGDGLLNDAIEILPRPITVAMATKFGTISATTRLKYQISVRALCITGGLGGWAIE